MTAIPKTLYDMLDIDNSLLSDVINVPTPFTSALTEMAIKNRCGHMVPYYQTIQDFKTFASYWFSAHQLSFDHLAKIALAEYSPIENTDRYETETISGTSTEDTSNTTTQSGSDSSTETGSVSREGAISDTDAITRSGSEAHTGTDTRTNTGTSAEAHTGTDTRTNTGTSAEAHTGTDTVTTTKTTEREIAGFNSADYSDADQVTESGTEGTAHGKTVTRTDNLADALQHGETVTRTDNLTDTLQHGETVTRTDNLTDALQHGETVNTSGSDSRTYEREINDSESSTKSNNIRYGKSITGSGEKTTDDERERETHVHGNIGVTTAQQMITDEINLQRVLNLYDTIAALFESDMFICVY